MVGKYKYSYGLRIWHLTLLFSAVVVNLKWLVPSTQKCCGFNNLLLVVWLILAGSQADLFSIVKLMEASTCRPSAIEKQLSS